MPMMEYQLTADEEKLYQQAMECFKKKNFEKALHHVYTMEGKNADNPLALYLKGSILLSVGRFQEANLALERFLCLCPEYEPAWTLCARANLNTQQFDKAEQCLKKITEPSRDGNFYDVEGQLAWMQQKWKKAAENFRRCWQAAPPVLKNQYNYVTNLAANFAALAEEQPNLIPVLLENLSSSIYRLAILENGHRTIRFQDSDGQLNSYSSCIEQNIELGKQLGQKIESISTGSKGIVFKSSYDGYLVFQIENYFYQKKEGLSYSLYILQKKPELLNLCFQLHDFVSLIQKKNIRFFLGDHVRKEFEDYLNAHPSLPRPVLEL